MAQAAAPVARRGSDGTGGLLSAVPVNGDGDTVVVLVISRPVHGKGVAWGWVWVGDCAGWLIDSDVLTPRLSGLPR